MKKALFFRNCNDITNYEHNCKNLPSYGNYLYYKIVKTIVLDNITFNDFISNLKKDYNFITNNKSIMIMDKNDVVSCLLISNNKTKILVYSAGYNNARYIAIPND